MVQGLDPDLANVKDARNFIRECGLYGRVSIDRLCGQRLPYIDNLANLVVVSDPALVPPEEVRRVLCPDGVACVRRNGQWVKLHKPRPGEIDEWTHYLHDASNNAVSHDLVVGPPRRLQWVGSPRYSRHHDRMSSVSAVVSAGGRVFYIFDEASPASILLPPKWTLIARDAFNGVVLWKRPIARWHTHLWPLKSGPAQLPRRLVAAGDRVYVTLSLDAPLTALDAATGRTIRVYEQTKSTEEVIYSEGVLFAMVNPQMSPPEFANLSRINRGYGGKFWDEKPRRLMAVDAVSGKTLWSIEEVILPGTLAADSRRVVFHDGRSVVCLNRTNGHQLWRSQPVERAAEIRSFYLPTLVLQNNVVLFSGGETAGLQTGSWYTSGKDTLTAIAADTGKVLWQGYHPPSGYRSPEDVLVIDNVVWCGETTSGRAKGVFIGRNILTGETVAEFSPNVDTYWFHHRCYRGKATERFLIMARAGTEFIDVAKHTWNINDWVRGACLYGVMPANGLLYAPQHPCACYLEAKLSGFNALAPAGSGPRIPAAAAKAPRLEKGPVYDDPLGTGAGTDCWPTYRHDSARSGRAGTAIPTSLEKVWRTTLGGKLTSPVIAGGKLFVAQCEQHTLHALDAESGRPLWHFTTGGRIDSPPTFYKGRLLFGSADGYVYCVCATDGALVWRFLAAPLDQRLVAFEQIESVWPVHGSVLVHEGVAWFVAGRSMFLDGGLRLWRLDAASGKILSETVLDERDRQSDKSLQEFVSWLNMPPALPDVLSTDGKHVFMRSQPFRLDGTRLPLEAMPVGADADRGAPPPVQRPQLAHLFCPTGLLDDTMWHRTYWMYGSTFVSGWCGYYLAGKAAPAGRILTFDDEHVYGFGRKPKFYRWTTPIEHQLFCAAKTFPPPEAFGRGQSKASWVRVEKSASLNPAGKPITVEAWIKAAKPNGVIVARGGAVNGYVLYLQAGRPHFAVRSSGKVAAATAKQKVVGRWVHVAGVLNQAKQLQLYVDGKLAAAVESPGMVAGNPQEALQIGGDENSTVGQYTGPWPFNGLIDEVAVYYRALDASTIAEHAAGAEPADDQSLRPVLRFSFNDGKAKDSSGHENHGTLEAVRVVAGRFGQALQFTGEVAAGGYLVTHEWTEDVPMLVRAMVLADNVLAIAGVPDLVDEEQAFRQIADPSTRTVLEEQAAALEGRKGALLWLVSPSSGQQVFQCRLASPPVFDGMAAALGRVYVCGQDGAVTCLGKP